MDEVKERLKAASAGASKAPRSPSCKLAWHGPRIGYVVRLVCRSGCLTSDFVTEGVRLLLAVEWELPAAATYAANFGSAQSSTARARDSSFIDAPFLGFGETPTSYSRERESQSSSMGASGMDVLNTVPGPRQTPSGGERKFRRTGAVMSIPTIGSEALVGCRFGFGNTRILSGQPIAFDTLFRNGEREHLPSWFSLPRVTDDWRSLWKESVPRVAL
jgi:hypothetical protein